MKLADFNAASAQVAAETGGEWTITELEHIAGRTSVAAVHCHGGFITRIHCYGQSADWLYTMVIHLVKACYAYESAKFDHDRKTARRAA